MPKFVGGVRKLLFLRGGRGKNVRIFLGGDGMGWEEDLLIDLEVFSFIHQT